MAACGCRACTCRTAAPSDTEHFEAKLAWLEQLRSHIAGTCDPSGRVAICGDFNIAPDDRDVWDPTKAHGATHVSEPERKALAAIKEWGLVDAFRERYDQPRLFSWWDYRGGDFHKGRGMRIDLVLASTPLAEPRTVRAHRPQRPQGQTARPTTRRSSWTSMTDEDPPADHRIQELMDEDITPRARRDAARRRLGAVRDRPDVRDPGAGGCAGRGDLAGLPSSGHPLEYPRRRPFEGFPEAANAGDPHAFFDHSPFAGRANPLAPPIEMEIAEDKVIARVNYGAAYEGPPGSVHGGHIAAAFDEVLGMAQSLGGQPGMTGTLTIRYRKPTPLHADIRIEAWITNMEGRKTFTKGTMYAGDLVTAEADAVFISVDMARIAELMSRRHSE